MDCLRELEDLFREFDQFLVLLVLLFDGPPLLAGNHLTAGVGPVLTALRSLLGVLGGPSALQV